ncbi:MAG: linear amide C-N hydrolase [Anaerolineales bacterium]|nr:linear amide C-N hydrolase [Anaerolineales bacterium]
MFNLKRSIILVSLVMIAGLLLLACAAPVTSVPATRQAAEATLSEQQIKTLGSLEKVDDYPLYTMHYYGWSTLSSSNSAGRQLGAAKLSPAWGCSLFAAMGDADKFYGRNFDWEASPALLLFNHPTDGYDSVSMVDMTYLGIDADINKLTELSLDQRQALLDAPFLPFDGMNERGLTIGMAAVPSGDMESEPNKETIDSLMVIRKILDQAGDVDEAVAILESYNIDWGSGPPLH